MTTIKLVRNIFIFHHFLLLAITHTPHTYTTFIAMIYENKNRLKKEKKSKFTKLYIYLNLIYTT